MKEGVWGSTQYGKELKEGRREKLTEECEGGAAG